MTLQNVIRTIKYIIVIALLFIPFKQAKSAKFIPVFNTDTPSYQLYYFWDLRDRESFFQLSNESSSTIKVHIQVFDANNRCDEFDFEDTYTPFDAHIYDVSAIDRNDGSPGKLPSAPEGDFGFVVVTVINNIGAVRRTPVLTGNFRIFDTLGGYEYGAKAAGYPSSSIQLTNTYNFNFNGINGTNKSDVVGIAVRGAGTDPVSASASISVVFNPLIFDLNENVLSCAPVTFACDSSHFDYGINSEVENSKGGPNICGGANDAGKVYLTFSSTNSNFFVGFIGLNNSEGLGNMSTFWANPFRLFSAFFNNTP